MSGTPVTEPGLPDVWLIVTPSGEVDGFLNARLGNGRVLSTADAAHRMFTRLKRDRDRELRDGWTVRGVTWAEARA